MNFILRTIEKESKNPFNRFIGDSYIKKSQKMNLEQWTNIVQTYFPEMNVDVIKTIEYLIIGKTVMPIYSGTSAYVMSENGQTFEVLPT